jgi:sigma-B regulation protein RsbQ
MNLFERYNVRVLGNGKETILFAHGYGCDQNMWRNVYPAFEQDYRIVLFDHMGSGQSDKRSYNAQRYKTLDGYADDVLSIAEALQLENAIFVGHSVSAMIGVLAHNRHSSHFNRMVMIGPSPRYINDRESGYIGGFEAEDIDELMEALESNYLGWSSTMAPLIMGNPHQPQLGRELTNSFCQMDPEIAKNFARATFMSDNREDLKHVKASCLILQCSDDIIAPVAVGEYVHRAIPKSRFVIMEATGHCPNLSAPQETIHHIQAFLDG